LGSAKDIMLRPIDSRTANDLVRRVHYSGKVVNNSQIHIGVFWQGKLEGALQFGNPVDRRKLVGLVKGTDWHGFAELNRMAFTDALPRNSESRALSVSFRLLRKHAPQWKWVVSFADATQSGHGIIYQAVGFVLTGIKRNHQILDWNGRLIAKKTLDNPNYPKVNGKYYSRYLLENDLAQPLPGYQLRYIYFLDPSWRQRLTVPEIPYSRIWEMGAGMYRGEKVQRAGEAKPVNAPGDQPGDRRFESDPSAPSL